MIAQLELEVAQLLAQADQADATPLQDGLRSARYARLRSTSPRRGKAE
jgi:hypothetical protein